MTPQCIPHHTQLYHTYSCILLCFSVHAVLVLGGHKEVPDGVASLEINLDSQLTTYASKTFT